MTDYLSQYLLNPAVLEFSAWLKASATPEFKKIIRFHKGNTTLKSLTLPFYMRDPNKPGQQSMPFRMFEKDLALFYERILAKDESVLHPERGCEFSKGFQIGQLYALLPQKSKLIFWDLFCGVMVIVKMISALPQQVLKPLDVAIGEQREKLFLSKQMTQNGGTTKDYLSGVDIEEFGPHIDALLSVDDVDPERIIEAFNGALTHKSSPLLKMMPEVTRDKVSMFITTLKKKEVVDGLLGSLKTQAEKFVESDPEAKEIVAQINEQKSKPGSGSTPESMAANRKLVVNILKFVLTMGIKYSDLIPKMEKDPMGVLATLSRDSEIKKILDGFLGMTGMPTANRLSVARQAAQKEVSDFLLN